MLLIIILGCSIFIGCSKGNIDMTYIKEPSGIVLVGDKNKTEIDKIKEDLKSLKQNSNNYKQQSVALIGRMAKLTNEASIEITDKEFINKIISEIKNKKGIAADFNDKNYVSNNAAYDMQFKYAGTNITEEKIKEGFIPDLYLYSDGTVMAAKYDSKSDLIAVKVSLDKETTNYIKEYYDTHLKK